MPLPKQHTYTSEDYWNLPDSQRAELIDGQLYNMAPPNRMHQEILSALHWKIRSYIAEHGGSCKVYPAPFAVNLDADDKDWVEPDISVICDHNKLTDRGCTGAIYSGAGVREYWIVDPAKQRTTVYHYEEDAAPMIYLFDQPVSAGIYTDLMICIADLLNN